MKMRETEDRYSRTISVRRTTKIIGTEVKVLIHFELLLKFFEIELFTSTNKHSKSLYLKERKKEALEIFLTFSKIFLTTFLQRLKINTRLTVSFMINSMRKLIFNFDIVERGQRLETLAVGFQLSDTEGKESRSELERERERERERRERGKKEKKYEKGSSPVRIQNPVRSSSSLGRRYFFSGQTEKKCPFRSK